ncbi:hypothetical protein [Xenorhabdus hominickii]|uniref:Uncharacterized protein n=1 Tax=Xenorhabdus hominickii TaxID=351679 RepID=A0A1V0M411_XENHO|nr:hypothetical protein [Xenorhabdus hominickii]ARD69609.1 hypothetical protein [Xenorhabdus hominickii]PHM52323.1 hypothetical protein Xhom_04400 [Xenorhabdus hominickii]
MINERLIFTETELSEFNDLMINSFLAQKLNLPLSGNARIWFAGEVDVQLKDGTKFDFNDPNIALPLIVKNKINIDHRESIKVGALASLSGFQHISAVDKAPVRAAMKVLLMMDRIEL